MDFLFKVDDLERNIRIFISKAKLIGGGIRCGILPISKNTNRLREKIYDEGKQYGFKRSNINAMMGKRSDNLINKN
ncbi:hypothetical protein HY310_00685 [Candidatus Microgenomates bacterium]|nr:hypothetical protein [Candidatus Microgenomates bacterium]